MSETEEVGGDDLFQPVSLLRFIPTTTGLVAQNKQDISYEGYLYQRNSGTGEGRRPIYYVCKQRKKFSCRGRMVIKHNQTFRITQGHSHPQDPFMGDVETAIARLRVLSQSAKEGERGIDIVRSLLKELPPEIRAAMPSEESLIRRARRWANAVGVQLARSNFEDYLVEEGLESVIPPPPPPTTTAAVLQVKEEPIAGPSSMKPKPDLVFLKGHTGEKHRVLIEDKIFVWLRDLVSGASVYRCLESRMGCPVTARIFRQEKQYEVKGVHDHELKLPQAKAKSKKLFPKKLKLVDEEGRDLGHVDADSIFTAGEDLSSFNQLYEELPRLDTSASSSAAQLPNATYQRDNEDEGAGDGSRLPEAEDFNNDFLNDDGGGDEDDFDFDTIPEEMEAAVPRKMQSTRRRSATVSTSSAVRTGRKERETGAVKSGEKCVMCGDDLVISEALSSSSQETFRKACCYLNVKSENGWFPQRRRSSAEGQFHSFCESCTNEVTRIHQLYQKVEEIQSLIFRKVEHVEKRIADAEIVDNWMAEAPKSSALRFEGFRKQVLINYRNKLKLRREIRVGAKFGRSFTEVQPMSTAHMFASDPAETDAFRKVAPTEGGPESNQADPPNKKSKRGRGRPKSKNVEQASQNILAMEDDDIGCGDDFLGFEGPHDDDDALSVASEKETKFWKDDPNKLQVGTDKNGNNTDDDDDAGSTEEGHGSGGGDHPWSGGEEQSDPDYVEDNDDDEDWGSSKTKKAKKGATGGQRRGRPKSKSTSTQPEPDSKATKPETQQKHKPHRDKNYELPEAVLTKAGRLFVSDHEIIKNPPGALPRKPNNISFTCATCGKIIESLWMMKQHIAAYHLGMFKCDICGKQFSCARSLEKHVHYRHMDKTRVNCEVCGKSINGTRPILLKYHMWSHLGEEEKKDPKYKSYCPPSKKDPNRLKRSRGLQTFMCSFCPATFYQVKSFKNHEMVHRGEGPTFQCQFCGKIFLSRKAMYLHSTSTTCARKPKPKEGVASYYPCPKCPQRFKWKESRARHLKKAHPVDANLPFSCPKCPRRFGTKGAFKSHKRVCVDGVRRGKSNKSSRNEPRHFYQEGTLPTSSNPAWDQGLGVGGGGYPSAHQAQSNSNSDGANYLFGNYTSQQR